ncbi:MAG: type II toxin-antitoxin system VapC family toxin [Cyanobacteriota bacterium]
MKYIIDTHTLIWYIDGDNKLSKKAVSILQNTNNQIYVSKVSLWEIAIKISISKLNTSIPFPELEKFLLDNNFDILEIGFKHFEHLLNLPIHHNDPFDRIIICQSVIENIPIITYDNKFSLYDVRIIT